MPELAAAYSLGFILCATLTLTFIFLVRHRRNSAPYVTVRENLRAAGFFYSENADRIVPLGPGVDEAHDRNRSERTIALTGGLLSFMSWVGLVFLLVLMISYRFLARSRLERALFSSRLSSDKNLSADETHRLLLELPGASEDLKPSLRAN